MFKWKRLTDPQILNDRLKVFSFSNTKSVKASIMHIQWTRSQLNIIKLIPFVITIIVKQIEKVSLSTWVILHGERPCIWHRGSSLKFNTSERLRFFYLIIYSLAENSVPTVHDQLVLMAETVWKSETISLL